MINKFAKLFKSNTKSYGQFIPKTGKMFSLKERYTDKSIENHLGGTIGLGLVPITNRGNCHWGAIDIDNHAGDEVNVAKIAKDVDKLGLPLVVCESKSGGAHCYLFGSEALPAHSVRLLLADWATKLGHKGAEVFPKQSKLSGKQLGNWINLPYFNMNTRKAYGKNEEGQNMILSFESFIKYANSMKIDSKMLDDFYLVDHREAPPCIQEMMKKGVESGYRNEGLYNLTVYLLKAFPDDYKERAFDVNQTIFEVPLSFAEAKKTVNSVANRDYKYKCLQNPCRMYCDSDTCLKRMHGISNDDIGGLSRADMPDISDLRIYDMEPPLWEMKINGITITITTNQFYNYAEFSKVVMEKLLIIIPTMKNRDWMNILAGMMGEATRIKTPSNASVPGIIKEKLQDFLAKADLTSNGKNTKYRSVILRGIPVVQEIGVEGIGGRNVIFRGGDFVAYLKRVKSEELKGSMLWNALSSFGVTHHRMRVDGRVRAIWAVHLDKYNRTKLDIDYMDREPPEGWEDKKEELGMQFKSEF